MAVQALQPRVKELQSRYANEPETLQLETAKLYKDAGVNPLAGCLPTLATIPIFIGLYKALSRAADEGLGQESFFWIPDLSGPTTMTERATVSLGLHDLWEESPGKSLNWGCFSGDMTQGGGGQFPSWVAQAVETVLTDHWGGERMPSPSHVMHHLFPLLSISCLFPCLYPHMCDLRALASPGSSPL